MVSRLVRCANTRHVRGEGGVWAAGRGRRVADFVRVPRRREGGSSLTSLRQPPTIHGP
jgi:hypothetical protein